MEDLRLKRQRLDADLAANRAELKKAKQSERNAQQATAKVWRLTAALERRALIAYVLAGYVAEPAVQFLASAGRKRRWPAKGEEQLQRMVEDVFAAAAAEEVAHLSDLSGPLDPPACKEALRWVEEWRLATWTKTQNSDKGVAPSTATVLERLKGSLANFPEHLQPSHPGVVAEPRARTWASRWRRRWGGRYGRLPVRDEVPLEEMQSKARDGASHCDLSPVWSCRLRLAAQFEERFGVSVLGSLGGPVFGTAFGETI